ncbi:MAG TPA: outer membrane protein assembly factor BamD [Pirellulaceae bacterium]|nr:outer membrane protein assembly factor BamD [Pirellulaceae bacterium]
MLVLVSGCASLQPGGGESASSRTAAPGEAQPASYEEPAENKLPFEDFSIDNLGKTVKKLTGNGPNREVAKQIFREADDIFRQALAAEPEKRAQIFEIAAPKYAAAAERWPDSALAMDALFSAGECYFFADNYPQASAQYEKLVKAFPNNRYQDTVDQRRFLIAKYWLALHHESPEPIYYYNWFNKSRPWRDARGNGLRIFDKIRIDDPTGRLADDATLAAGNEHFLAGKFYKADEYYSDLRKAYPTSEHQFLAHFVGLKAKLNCYQGPEYGGTLLDEAEKLVKQIRRQFPQEAQQEREFLDRAAAEIRYLKAQRLMFLAEYYDQRSQYGAAHHYYDQVAQQFSDTPLAQRAGARIGQIAGLPAKPAQVAPWLVGMFPESDKVKPLLAATERARQAGAQQGTEQAAPDEQRLADRPAATANY